LVVAAGLIGVGLCGLCAAQFARGPILQWLPIVAIFTTPGMLVGVGLVLLGRRIGWRKTDGVEGWGRAFRIVCAAMMVALGLLGCGIGMTMTLSMLGAGALPPIAALTSTIAAGGIFWGGLLLWPDRHPPVRVDDVF
jgi:hypothetical protein